MATIRQRDNKYQVQIRRNGQGQLTKTFNIRRDAIAWARQMEVQADRKGLPVDDSILKRLTLGDLVVRYRDTVTPRKKNKDWEEICLNAFLRHPICKRNLACLSSEDFARFRDERLESVTVKSLKRQLSPVRNLFEIARDEWGLPIRENPLDKVRLKAVDNRRERRLREGELDRILEASSNRQNPYVVPIILFALETAMRRGELLSLRWVQVDWKRRSVSLPDSKNGHPRTIPLTPKALEILRSIEPISERVFLTTVNAVRLTWQRIIKDANIEDLHFHDLRHEGISRLFELGLTAPEVALVSGHKDVRMLFRYAHANLVYIHQKIDKSSASFS